MSQLKKDVQSDAASSPHKHQQVCIAKVESKSDLKFTKQTTPLCVTLGMLSLTSLSWLILTRNHVETGQLLGPADPACRRRSLDDYRVGRHVAAAVVRLAGVDGLCPTEQTR